MLSVLNQFIRLIMSTLLHWGDKNCWTVLSILNCASVFRLRKNHCQDAVIVISWTLQFLFTATAGTNTLRLCHEMHIGVILGNK